MREAARDGPLYQTVVKVAACLQGIGSPLLPAGTHSSLYGDFLHAFFLYSIKQICWRGSPHHQHVWLCLHKFGNTQVIASQSGCQSTLGTSACQAVHSLPRNGGECQRSQVALQWQGNMPCPFPLELLILTPPADYLLELVMADLLHLRDHKLIASLVCLRWLISLGHFSQLGDYSPPSKVLHREGSSHIAVQKWGCHLC